MMTKYAIEASAELYGKLREIDEKIGKLHVAERFGMWAKNRVASTIATVDASNDETAAAIKNLLLAMAKKDRAEIERRLRQHGAPVPELILTKD